MEGSNRLFNFSLLLLVVVAFSQEALARSTVTTPSCSCDGCRYPVADQCSAFWQCEKGKATKHSCSSGLLFNRDTGSCDSAIKVDCTAGAWEKGSFIESSCIDRRKDCETFAKEGGCNCHEANCDWQTFILRNCPKSCGSCGTPIGKGEGDDDDDDSSSSESNSSDSSESSSSESNSSESGGDGSGEGGSGEGGEGGSGEGGEGGSGEGGNGGDNGNGGDGGNGNGGDGGNGGGNGGDSGNVGIVDGCVIDCSKGQYFPHPSDCRQFIQCAPYGPQEMPCGPGTLWDQQILTCNHESTTPCVTGNYFTPDGKACGGAGGQSRFERNGK